MALLFRLVSQLTKSGIFVHDSFQNLTLRMALKKNRAMKPNLTCRIPVCAALLAAGLCLNPAFAQTESASPSSSSSSAAPNPMDPAMMKQMMELAKLNENHKLLADMAGNWNHEVKMWMAPGAPPMLSKGTTSRKAIMDGRFFMVDVTGSMKMPDETGKLKDFAFKGTSMEGYDNVKKKFIATWSDNMGTGIMMSEGTYDSASKSFTYTAEMEMMPGMKMKVREVVKIVDKDHHTFEWFEDRGGKEEKTMEISYTRKK